MSQLSPKSQIQLGKTYGYATVEVVDVIDDNAVKVKKMFGKEKAVQDLLTGGEKGDAEHMLAYKCLPYIDQTKVRIPAFKEILSISKADSFTDVLVCIHETIARRLYRNLSRG